MRNIFEHTSSVTMAGLDPATQRDRVCGRNKWFFGAQTRACWVAGSGAGHGEKKMVITGGTQQ